MVLYDTKTCNLPVVLSALFSTICLLHSSLPRKFAEEIIEEMGNELLVLDNRPAVLLSIENGLKRSRGIYLQLSFMNVCAYSSFSAD